MAAPREIRQRVYRRKVDPFQDYDNVDFLQRYRVTKNIARYIIDGFVAAGYGRIDSRGHALTDDLMVLTGLRYFATGSMYRDIGDSHGVSRSSVARGVRRLGEFLRRNANGFIKMPETWQEMYAVAEDFYIRYGMPRCAGAVDGSHINIIAPSENEAHYINRHQAHSLNRQACCDSRLIFSAVEAKQPGSTHDNFTFTNSDIGIGCAEGALGDFFLLGDSGYALRPWIMTPFLRPQGQAQQRYNRTHCAARSVIERAFGHLKIRFRCLSRTGGDLQTAPINVANMVIACCVLHNIAEAAKLPLPEDAADVVPEVFAYAEVLDDGTPVQVEGNAQGARVRDALVNNVFRRVGDID